MKKFKNMTELELYRQKLKYRELLLEKDLVNASSDLVQYFTDELKEFAFNFGFRIIRFLFRNKEKDEDRDKKK
jgi:hypothetical protein